MATKSPRLVKELRSLFGAARWLVGVSLLIFIGLFFVSPSKSVWHPIGMARVPITTQASAFTPKSDSPHQGELHFKSLEGRIAARNFADDSALRPVVRWIDFWSLLVPSLIALAFVDALWRLCRHVENGRIFTAANFGLVRWLGALIIIATLTDCGIQTWSSYYLAHFLQDHVSLDGLTFVASRPVTNFATFVELLRAHFTFDLSYLITGLLVLGLASVFQQGLALKEEADLTV